MRRFLSVGTSRRGPRFTTDNGRPTWLFDMFEIDEIVFATYKSVSLNMVVPKSIAVDDTRQIHNRLGFAERPFKCNANLKTKNTFSFELYNHKTDKYITSWLKIILKTFKRTLVFDS